MPYSQRISQKKGKKNRSLSYSISLFEHLTHQAKEVFSSPKDLTTAESIIGNLDQRGFLGEPPAPLERLKTIQTFDPPGVGARNLKESLLIQLSLKGNKQSITYYAIDRYFEDLLSNRLPEIKKRVKIPIKKLQLLLQKEMASLDFHPGHRFLLLF